MTSVIGINQYPKIIELKPTEIIKKACISGDRTVVNVA